MPSFLVTWDYRCPFARNAHEHVVAGLQAGAGWDVGFVPFSLEQANAAEGHSVWDDPAKAPFLLAMQAGIVARDRFPERFLDAHLALFAARHDHGRDVRREDTVRHALAAAGIDPDGVLRGIAEGWPLEAFRKEHEAIVAEHSVWGVPTFITAGEAVFVRLMHRPGGDADLARGTVERILELARGWPELNELKRTTIPR